MALMQFCQGSDEKNACCGAGRFAEGRNSSREKKKLFLLSSYDA